MLRWKEKDRRRKTHQHSYDFYIYHGGHRIQDTHKLIVIVKNHKVNDEANDNESFFFFSEINLSNNIIRNKKR